MRYHDRMVAIGSFRLYWGDLSSKKTKYCGKLCLHIIWPVHCNTSNEKINFSKVVKFSMDYNMFQMRKIIGKYDNTKNTKHC